MSGLANGRGAYAKLAIFTRILDIMAVSVEMLAARWESVHDNVILAVEFLRYLILASLVSLLNV